MIHERQDASLPGEKLKFVLSAGRTGTVFLTHALASRFPDFQIVHEPPPARTELMLANFRNRSSIGGRALRALFKNTRERRIDDLGSLEASIEINPLLCPLTDVVGQVVAPLTVVHLVRHPVTWVESITRFGASGWRKHVIDLVPFAKPHPFKRPPNWHSLDGFGKALWRWRYCNEQILDLKDRAAVFVTVRYEDLFAADTVTRSKALSTLLRGLGLDSAEPYDWFDIDIRANSSGEGSDVKHTVAPKKIEATCGALMQKFGYGDVPTRS